VVGGGRDDQGEHVFRTVRIGLRLRSQKIARLGQPRCPFDCVNLSVMFVSDDNGQVLDAEFFVEQEKDHLALILSSSSGRAGSRLPRNSDYRPALALLLSRLRDLNAVIQDALVDSRTTQRRGLDEAQRRLISSPIWLVDEPDIEALRLRLTSAQARIAQAPDASKGGNSTKRIRLRLKVPGFPADASGLLACRLTCAFSLGLERAFPPGGFSHVVAGCRTAVL
jgi:hypothetical protein